MSLLLVDPISGATCSIPDHQWGYTEGKEYLTREYGSTPHGVLYRERIDPTRRILKIRVVATDTIIEPLRTLAILAQRHGGRIQFYPDDSDLGTYRWVDWQPETDWQRVIENRGEVELTLTEQAA